MVEPHRCAGHSGSLGSLDWVAISALFVAILSFFVARKTLKDAEDSWKQEKWFDLYAKADEGYNTLDRYCGLARMKGNFVKTSIASNPTPVNIIVESPTTKKVVQWLTVRHPEGAVVSYPMFRADEGLAWLEMHETLRPGRYDNCRNSLHPAVLCSQDQRQTGHGHDG